MSARIRSVTGPCSVLMLARSDNIPEIKPMSVTSMSERMSPRRFAASTASSTTDTQRVEVAHHPLEGIIEQERGPPEVVFCAVQAHIEPIGCEQLLRAIKNPLSTGCAIFLRLSGGGGLGHASRMVRSEMRVYVRWRRALAVSSAAPSSAAPISRMITPTATATNINYPLPPPRDAAVGDLMPLPRAATPAHDQEHDAAQEKREERTNRGNKWLEAGESHPRR